MRHQEQGAKNSGSEPRWLLLIHQIPPKPGYFRVKIWRRLQTLGAVAIKNSVYVLPNGDQAQEDFQWILREIKAGGGDAMVCEAKLIEGLSDRKVQGLFQAARGKDYADILDEARKFAKSVSKRGPSAEQRAEVSVHWARLQRRLTEVGNIDFFDAPGRAKAEELLREIEASLRSTRSAKGKAKVPKAVGTHRPRQAGTWVTRRGIHVDRMASAWLIRRFIDPEAQFKFVPSTGYLPRAGESRFDMFEAEYTHEGDRCTFEVLLERFALKDPALRAVGEIVHDIDLKDSKFGRQEALGIGRLVGGIAMAYKDDETRLQHGLVVFEDLYQYFHRQPDSSASGR